MKCTCANCTLQKLGNTVGWIWQTFIHVHIMGRGRSHYLNQNKNHWGFHHVDKIFLLCKLWCYTYLNLAQFEVNLDKIP